MKKTILIALIAFIAVVIYVVKTNDFDIKTIITQKEVLKSYILSFGWKAPFIFILTYILITVACAPASVLSLFSGFFFGTLLGATYTFIGATSGATASFLIGRYIAHDFIQKKFEGRLNGINEISAVSGFILVFSLRFIPIPFFISNYGLSLTKISLRDYVVGTALGLVIPCLIFANAGSAIGELKSGEPVVSTKLVFSLALLGLFALSGPVINHLRKRR